MTAKLDPKERQQQILDAAVSEAARVGFTNIQRADIAAKLEISTGLINRYFSTMTVLKRDVMRSAVVRLKKDATDKDALAVLAQGVVLKDRQALKAPENLRNAALKMAA
jgi:AcrR family transcriptional regulator